jgi:hypothetical protein
VRANRCKTLHLTESECSASSARDQIGTAVPIHNLQMHGRALEFKKCSLTRIKPVPAELLSKTVTSRLNGG